MRVKFNNPYWSEKARIEFLQRAVIVNAFLYYELSEPVLQDREYDELSQQLLEAQNEAETGDLRRTQYYYCMEDFDGTTAFDVFSRLTTRDQEIIMAIARSIKSSFQKEKQNGKAKNRGDKVFI